MHGYPRGHKEMAGAYGMDKAAKPQIKAVPKAIKNGTGKK